MLHPVLNCSTSRYLRDGLYGGSARYPHKIEMAQHLHRRILETRSHSTCSQLVCCHNDKFGRFTANNPGGPGNPHIRRVAGLRAALLKAVTPEDVREVMAALLAKAKAGEIAAIKGLFQRLLGPPVALDLTERPVALEQRVEELLMEERSSW